MCASKTSETSEQLFVYRGIDSVCILSCLKIQKNKNMLIAYTWSNNVVYGACEQESEEFFFLITILCISKEASR